MSRAREIYISAVFPPGEAIHVRAGPSINISIIIWYRTKRGDRLRIFISFEFLVELVRHERLVHGETIIYTIIYAK